MCCASVLSTVNIWKIRSRLKCYSSPLMETHTYTLTNIYLWIYGVVLSICFAGLAATVVKQHIVLFWEVFLSVAKHAHTFKLRRLIYNDRVKNTIIAIVLINSDQFIVIFIHLIYSKTLSPLLSLSLTSLALRHFANAAETPFSIFNQTLVRY